MSKTKEQINEMIFKTLKTDIEKPAKFAEELTELGYTFEQGCYKWKVNDLQMYGSPYSLCGREKLENIKKIDFVNYFAVKPMRVERDAEARKSDKFGIVEERHYFVAKRVVYYNAEGDDFRYWRTRDYCKKQTRRSHSHSYYFHNRVVEKYNNLRAKSNGNDGWRVDVSYAKSRIDSAEKDVEKLEKMLARAKAEYMRAVKELENVYGKMHEATDELDAFLKEHGVR